jgi:CRISPR-associated protein Csm3
MRIEIITSQLRLLTGLHIGAGDDTMSIGGVDSLVIKREVFADDNGDVKFGAKNIVVEPYIAGSSIKGKLRSLLEHYFRLIDPNGEGKVVDSNSIFGAKDKKDLIVELFGESADSIKNDKKIKASRAIFRDCFITTDIRKAYINI